MATKPDPMTFDEARDRLPLYAVGLEVRVWYMGLLGPDEPLDPKHRVTTCRVEGIRLKPDGREGWDDAKQEATREVDYPKGWEYLAVGPDGSEDGWLSEADLQAKGYAPAPSIYAARLEALRAVKALWDKHGMGDEDAESEPVYKQLCAALAGGN